MLSLAFALACGLAPSAGALVAARAAEGLGAALMAPAALSLILAMFPEGRERTHDQIDLVTLDQLDGFRFRRGRDARGVGDDKLDFSAAKHVVFIFEETRDSFLEMHAAGGEAAGFDGH